jgi:hypothetical protein
MAHNLLGHSKYILEATRGDIVQVEDEDGEIHRDNW